MRRRLDVHVEDWRLATRIAQGLGVYRLTSVSGGMFMFNSPRVATGICGGDKSCTKGARPRVPRDHQKIGTEGSMKLIKITSSSEHQRLSTARLSKLSIMAYRWYCIMDLERDLLMPSADVLFCPFCSFKASEVVRVEH